MTSRQKTFSRMTKKKFGVEAVLTPVGRPVSNKRLERRDVEVSEASKKAIGVAGNFSILFPLNFQSSNSSSPGNTEKRAGKSSRYRKVERVLSIAQTKQKEKKKERKKVRRGFQFSGSSSVPINSSPVEAEEQHRPRIKCDNGFREFSPFTRALVEPEGQGREADVALACVKSLSVSVMSLWKSGVLQWARAGGEGNRE